jgi:hypothetical protein
MDDPETIRNWTVIQDFNNKKANAHATIFIASLFGLFSILSLMGRLFSPISSINSSGNYNVTVFILLSFSYWLIWAFGLYSLGNFTYY